jgi:hypothetical protein
MRIAFCVTSSVSSGANDDPKFVPLSSIKFAIASSVNTGNLTVGIRHARFDGKKIRIGATGYADGHTYSNSIGHLEGYAVQQLRTLLRRAETLGVSANSSTGTDITSRARSVLTGLDREETNKPLAAAIRHALSRLESDHALAKKEVLPLCDMGRSVFRYYVDKNGKHIAIQPDRANNGGFSNSFLYTDRATKSMQISPSDISIAYEDGSISNDDLEAYHNAIKDMQSNNGDKLNTSLVTMPEYISWLKFIRSPEQAGSYNRLFNMTPSSDGSRVPNKIRALDDAIQIFYCDDTGNKPLDISQIIPEVFVMCNRELSYDSSILDSKMLEYGRSSAPLFVERAPFRGLITKTIVTSKDEIFFVIWRMVQEDRTEVLNKMGIDPSSRKEGDMVFRLASPTKSGELQRINKILDELESNPDAANQLPTEMFSVCRFPANSGNCDVKADAQYKAGDAVPMEHLLGGTYRIVRDTIANTFYDPIRNETLYGFADSNTHLIRVIPTSNYETLDELVNSVSSDAFTWVRTQFSNRGRTMINGKKAWSLALIGTLPPDTKEDDLFVRYIPIKGVADTTPDSLFGEFNGVLYDFVHSWWSFTEEEARTMRENRRDAADRRRAATAM